MQEEKGEFLISNRVCDYAELVSSEAQVGSTFYLFDLDAIKSKIISCFNAFSSDFDKITVAYSYKTNNLRAITQLARQLGCCAEVVSGAELEMALEDGFLGSHIFFDGPVKTEAELSLALSNEVNIQVDSLVELSSIILLYKKIQVKPKVCFRVSVGYENRMSRFGFSSDDFLDGLRILRESGLTLSGIHFHAGSNINDPKKYIYALSLLIDKLRDLSGLAPPNEPLILDIGGGFPAESFDSTEKVKSISEFSGEICRFMKDNSINLDKIELVIEPGRFFVEDNGFLVTRISSIKTCENKNIAVLEAGTNLVRSIKSWYHPIKIIQSNNTVSNDIIDIYGSNCFEKDIFCQSYKLTSQISVGDMVIIGSAGGYDIPSCNTWTRPSPAILGIMNGKIRILRKQGSVRDMRYLCCNIYDGVD